MRGLLSTALAVELNSSSASASSSNTKVATVTVDGTRLLFKAVSAGDAIITVTDSAGATVKFTVKVPGELLAGLKTNVPADITFTPGLSSQYRVSGGAAPYSIAVSNPNVIAAAVATGVVSVTAANPGTATVIVFDAVGGSAKFDVTVTGAGESVELYTTAPESLNMTGKSSSEFTVNGGVGPYVVTTTNAEVVNGTIAGNKLTVTSGVPGRAMLNLRDASGSLLVVTVTVAGEFPSPFYSTAPSNVTLSAGSAPTYLIQGGTAPYIASTSNADVAQASVVAGNQLLIKGISGGVADTVVFGSEGESLKVSTTVSGGTGPGTVPLYSTAPESITVAAGANPSYQIQGGTAPYTASTSNSDVALASISAGNQLQIKGVAAGVADIAVFDRAGASFKVSATVGGGTGPVPLYSTAPDLITVGVGANPTYKIGGRAAPYAITSSDVAVATITQTSNTFTVKGVASGRAGVSVRDANGTAVNIVVEFR